MAGSVIASLPIIVLFLIFQKSFTAGIAMSAVKG
jgi:multiple sugar transport system permease protein